MITEAEPGRRPGALPGSNLTVLNGSQGLNEMAVGVAAQGLSIFDTLRNGLASSSVRPATGAKGNGKQGDAEAPG